MRPRFCAAAGVCLLALLSSCVAYGPGIAELPASAGWQRLPIGSWVVNEGLKPKAIVYCPAASCARPAMVAVFAMQGDMARRLDRSLADPAALLRAKRQKVATARDPRFQRPAAASERKSRERAEPITADGLSGYRVALTPDIAGGHPTYAVVLARRGSDTVTVALAVTTDAEAALRQARAAARTF